MHSVTVNPAEKAETCFQTPAVHPFQQAVALELMLGRVVQTTEYRSLEEVSQLVATSVY